MCEEPSKTANHQRFDEMLIHLTPIGALVPYSFCVLSVCLDGDHNLWVAAKGGLFKFGAGDNTLLWHEKNSYPKKTSPYCQVLHHDGKIISAFADEPSVMTNLKIRDSNGKVISEQFIDGRVRSLIVSDAGDMYLTKRIAGEDSVIYTAHIDTPLSWEEVVSEDEFEFQVLCAISSNLLIASTCSIPVNMYSKQSLRLIDVGKQAIIKKFSEKGKKDGQIHFPLSVQKYGDDVLVLDKTGRIQQFATDGHFIRIASQIDAYLGNAFIVDDDKALLACSGIVLDRENQTICDDWLEKIDLDGSKWTPDPYDKKH